MSLRTAVRKVATWVLAASLLLSAAGVAYVATDPPHPTEPGVELYALHDGEPRDFDVELAPGQTGTVTPTVVSHERKAVAYTVVTTFADEELSTAHPTLNRGESWSEQVEYAADDPGQYDLRIRLYRGEAASGDPVATVRLGVTVGEDAGDDGGAANEDVDADAREPNADQPADDARDRRGPAAPAADVAKAAVGANGDENGPPDADPGDGDAENAENVEDAADDEDDEDDGDGEDEDNEDDDA